MSDIVFQLVGLPWWLVLPFVVAAAGLAGWLCQRELRHQPERVRRWLPWMRRAAVALVLVMLLEPVLTRTARERELPTLAVVIDRTGSMALDDRAMSSTARLDEAEALGLLPDKARADAGRTLAVALTAIAEDLPALARAVGGRAEGAKVDPDAPERLTRHHTALSAPRPAALVEVTAELDQLAALMQAASAAVTAGTDAVAVSERLLAAQDAARKLASRAEAAQRAADSALVATLEPQSPLAQALSRLSGMSRAARAERLAREVLTPRLKGRAEVSILALGGTGSETGTLAPWQPDSQVPCGGATDFAAPLAELARSWSGKHLGGVLLLSDGRQTIGADPQAQARALSARGSSVWGVLVGDEEPPRDAAVASVSGPNEVFKGETVHLDVRWRVAGYADRAFDLTLYCGDQQLERRTVRGDGNWKVERFIVAADKLPQIDGPVSFRARIDASKDLGGGSVVKAGGGLQRELWSGVGGIKVSDFFTAGSAPRTADQVAVIDRAEVVDNTPNYACRIRGWVIPPETGPYVFWISGDDETELWIGAGGTPYDKIKAANVPEWTQPNEWDRFDSQHSAPVTLEAGRPCYVEVLQKNGAGGGHLSIGWQTPSNRVERPIAPTQLTPWREGIAGAPDDDAARPEASSANNEADWTVAVNQDPLRVLVLDHQPRWDLRYLTALFERDRRVDVVRRYAAVRQPRGEDEMLPLTQNALDAYDVVVLGDLAPGEMSTDDQDRLATFVKRRGGFLLAIAGPRGLPWDYSLGGLADCLPVRAVSGPPGVAPLRVALAQGGEQHAVTRLSDDPQLNKRLWAALPPVLWAARSGITAKANAQVLLVAADAAEAPLVVAARYGAGRVLYVGTDETWRWRDPLADRVHQTFWLQAMRWGLGGRLRGKDPRLQAALDRSLINPGEAAELRVRARSADGAAAGMPRVRLEHLGKDGNPEAADVRQPAMTAAEDTDLWSVRLSDLPEGRWRLSVTSDHPELAGLSEVRELVVHAPPAAEGVDLGSDPAGLARLAEAGGGRSVGMAGALAMVDDLAKHLEPRFSERRKTWSLWQNHLSLLLISALLTAEWLWRKRHGLP